MVIESFRDRTRNIERKSNRDDDNQRARDAQRCRMQYNDIVRVSNERRSRDRVRIGDTDRYYHKGNVKDGHKEYYQHINHYKSYSHSKCNKGR